MSGNLRGKPLMGLLALAFALIAAYEAAEFIISGDTTGLIYIAIAFVLAAFVVSMLHNWRRGVYIFFAWLLFEDFARKYMGNNMAIYFAKDLLVAVVYLTFFLAWRRRQAQSFRPPFFVPIMMMVWFGFLQVFNPASPHPIYGILGMKLFFYYIPLMFVGYALMDSETELRRFLKVNLALMVLVACLGIAQSILGPTFLNPATLQEDIKDLATLYRVAPISGAIVYRPTSVFVSTGRFVDMLIVAWLLSLGFLGYSLLRYQRGRPLAFVSVSVVAAGMALSASRGAFLWGIIDVIVVVVAFFWGAPWRHGGATRVIRALSRVGLGICLAVAFMFLWFPEALLGRLALYSETLSPDSPQSELLHRARDYPLLGFQYAFEYDRWPYGYGIGTTALGTQYVAKLVGVKPPVPGVESGFGVIVVEMGIVGLILWVIMSAAILLCLWKIILRLRGSVWFPLGFIIFLYGAFLLVPEMVGGIQAYEDFLLNAYFWLLLGVFFRLPHLKAKAEVKSAELALAAQQPRWVT